MKKKFYMFSDPSHAWLRVDRQTLTDMNLNQNHFTEYSYVDFDFLYLEEDTDAEFFLKKYQEKFKIKPEIVKRTSNKYSFVRKKYKNYLVKG